MGGWMDSHFRLSVFLQSTERGRTGGIPTGDGYTRNDPSCARYRRRLEHSGRINRIGAVPLTQFIHSHDDDDGRRRGRGRMEGGIERVCAGDAVGNADATTTEDGDDEERARDASEGHRDGRDCRVGRGCSCRGCCDDESDDDERCRCASRRGGV